jgi:phosphoglycerate dehydrogenase-like enzyme
MSEAKYRIGVSRDLLDQDGHTIFDPVALRVLDVDPMIEWEWFRDSPADITVDHVAAYDAICLGAPGVPATALGRTDQRTRIVARFGVGYDNCDVGAMTAASVLLTINPDGVRRPVATSILTYILALAHRVPIMDRITREGRWNEKMQHVGTGLTGRTLGSIGVGNIGRELFRLARPLEMRHIAYDPFAKADEVEALGVTLCDFDTVLAQSDFLAVNCPLNASTRGLLGGRALCLMKPTAFLINTARGGIVDEHALYETLRLHRIAGAAIDVFGQEPVATTNPLLTLDNIIVSPHAICYTDECLRLLAEGAFKAALAFLHRRMPHQVVNPEVLAQPTMKEWFRDAQS